MANMSQIASMLAQSGANIGQQIGAPVASFGQGLGGMLTARQEKQEQQAVAQEVQSMLKKHANDPAQLNALGQKYASEGNNDMAKLFYDASKTAKTASSEKGELALFNMARMMQASPDEDISRNNKKREAYLEIAKGYGVSAERALEILEESVDKEKEGSKAKGYKVEDDVLINGKLTSVVDFFDAEGNFLNRRVVGEVEGKDSDGPRGRDDWKNPEIAAYTTAVSDQRAAGAEAIKYSDLLNDTIEIAGEAGQVGGFLGMARDFTIADVAGLGDAITVHRARLNEVRMKNAIALLPRGPASDRDVKLALDASVDPKNLNAEDRVAYIRGMKKIADAEKEYMDGKLRWIEQTGDALAFGYERKVSLDGYGKQLDALRQDNSSEVDVLDGQLQQVKKLADSGNREAAMELIEFVRSQDEIGYLSLLESQQAEQQRYDDFVEKNNITFN